MISIILYGRNDAHGYNLHRRAALSLNCLAEVLTADDDEIVFVDDNTPDELPTFVEALADTLTDRCLSRLRVFRVPAALHRERFQAATHLPAVEPVCRNAAARRANPANRWLLSTNTDMILVPYSEESLSDVCRGLADAYYALPRFELPEWLWEQLPRSDPRAAMKEVARLGPLLHLDEPSPSHEWVRFDAPGDFQLCLRDDFVAVDGFDERMLLGWHVDSNLSRRMFLHRGYIESLEDALAGYHCNHNRTPTVYHGQPVGNDHIRFFLAVEHADIPDQRETWGLADIALDEVRVGTGAGARFADALVDAIRPATHHRPPWNPFEAAFAVTYDSAHVLPHIADSIAVSGRALTVGYLGANPILREMIDRVVQDLSHDGSLRALYAADARELDGLADSADLLIVDLGLDATLESELPSDADGPTFDLPASLLEVVIAFDRLVHMERARLERGAHPRRFLLVNSTTVHLDTYVVANLDCSSRATHSRVRRATVKLVPTSEVPLVRTARWADRGKGPIEPLRLHISMKARFDDLEEFAGFGPGWWLPDPGGVWTRGSQAVLTLSCGRFLGWTRPVLALTFDRVGVRRGRPVRISLVIDGTAVDTRVMTGGSRFERWRVRLPDHAVRNRVFSVALEFDRNVEWADRNQLGLHLRSLEVESGAIPTRLRNGFAGAAEALSRPVRRFRRTAVRWKARLLALQRSERVPGRR